MCKFLFAFLTGIFCILFVFGSVFSTKPKTPSKKIDMSLTLSSEPELNKECTIIFSFTPLEDIDHRNELNDEAQIYFYPKDGIEIIHGVPLWEGRLTKWKKETIQIIFKPTKPGYFQFDGMVKSCRVNPNSIPKNPRLKQKIAKKVYEKIFAYRNIVSKSLQIGEPFGEKDKWFIIPRIEKEGKLKVGDDSPVFPTTLPPDSATLRKMRQSKK